MLKPASVEAYQLLHRGTLALANVEANGIRVDTDYLDKALEDIDHQIKRGRHKLEQSKVWKLWVKEFGGEAGLGKPKQLAHIIFDVMGYPVVLKTGKGAPSTEEEAFNHVDLPFIKRYFKLKKLDKARGTYLKGIKRETCDGFLYNFFHLHLVRTFRSSSSLINFQNIPVRDPFIAEIIRRCFIPRSKDRVLVEIDFSGIEVRIAACYNQDPVLISYIKDKTKDMHRDMAAQCYKCKPEQVSKMSRYAAKNMFVFPEFYGSYFAQCAPNLWGAIAKFKLEADGTSLDVHLQNQGIKSLGELEIDRFTKRTKTRKGTFYHHIREVEEDFWGRRFKVYAAWKKQWYDKYLRNGGFHTLTGFTEESYLSRNDVINHPVQGSAFHCLLWTLIRLNDYLVKSRMKSMIVGQIHDSIVGDVYLDELDDYLEMAKWTMTKDLREHWKWICVPIEVEVDVTPPGGSWHEKKPVEITA